MTLSEQHRARIGSSGSGLQKTYQAFCTADAWVGTVQPSEAAAQREHDEHVLAAGE